MRTLNLKRAAILLVAVIAVAGSAHLLHSFQLQRNSAVFKNQAEAAWNDHRITEALQMMRDYLRVAPSDLEAREELGIWYDKSGRFSLASATLEELLRTLETPPDPRTLEKQTPPDLPTIQRLRWKLVDLDMNHLSRPGDALDYLKKLADELPDDPEVWNDMGRCLNGVGKEEEALASFSRPSS